MKERLLPYLHYFSMIFLLIITMYAFIDSMGKQNFYASALWGLIEGVVTFLLLLNVKMRTVPKIITDERGVLGQILLVSFLFVSALLTNYVILILLIIDFSIAGIVCFCEWMTYR